VLSRRTKYGLKALFALAARAGHGPVLVSELAVRDAIPKKFLEAILLDLKRHGLVDSKKGKGGGYYLRRGPREIAVGDVVRALEGPLALVPCVSQTAYMRCSDCVDEETCGVRLAMRKVRDATAEILDNTTLEDISRRVESRRAKRGRDRGSATRDRG
jgi:Rrf2 family protein